MSAMFSKSNKKSQKTTSKIIINKEVKDYGKDPFFVEKAEASKKVIEKYGLPKELLKKG